jgi:hypothetical protein
MVGNFSTKIFSLSMVMNTDFQNYVSANDIYSLQKAFEIAKLDLPSDREKEFFKSEMDKLSQTYSSEHKALLLNFSYELFSIKPSYDYITIPSITLGSLIGVIIAFEITRRIFYYIVLGNIRPKKKHESDTVLP